MNVLTWFSIQGNSWKQHYFEYSSMINRILLAYVNLCRLAVLIAMYAADAHVGPGVSG